MLPEEDEDFTGAMSEYRYDEGGWLLPAAPKPFPLKYMEVGEVNGLEE